MFYKNIFKSLVHTELQSLRKSQWTCKLQELVSTKPNKNLISTLYFFIWSCKENNMLSSSIIFLFSAIILYMINKRYIHLCFLASEYVLGWVHEVFTVINSCSSFTFMVLISFGFVVQFSILMTDQIHYGIEFRLIPSPVLDICSIIKKK